MLNCASTDFTVLVKSDNVFFLYECVRFTFYEYSWYIYRCFI